MKAAIWSGGSSVVFGRTCRSLICRAHLRMPSRVVRNFSKIVDFKTDNFMSPASSVYLEDMYRKWQTDHGSVHGSWDSYFRNVTKDLPPREAYQSPPMLVPSSEEPVQPVAETALTPEQLATFVRKQMAVYALIRSYQVLGHLVADIDPLQLDPRKLIPELDFKTHGLDSSDMSQQFLLPQTSCIGGNRTMLSLAEICKLCSDVYCRSIGIQYMYIPRRDQCQWIREKFETPNARKIQPEEKKLILDRLMRSSCFERFLEKKWPAEKRFGLEGCEVLVPALNAIIDTSSDLGVESFVMGMSHRGRLNVVANVLQKPLEQIFAQFKGVEPGEEGSGDVKYHLGLSTELVNEATGKQIRLALCANPSHLEAVNPVVQGKTRAEQFYLGDASGKKVMSIIMHGDAAFAGQGVVYETFHLSALPDYTTHGTIHIVVNNQIGFTTDPRVARSSPYCTDVARVVNAPIFHVNANDPEAVHRVCRVAVEWRATFHKDVVIDLVGYRLHGHNEVDEPMFTQPIMYKKIHALKPVLELYAEKLTGEGLVTSEKLEEDIRNYVEQCNESATKADKITHFCTHDWLDSPWSKFFPSSRSETNIEPTSVDEAVLAHIGEVFGAEPPGVVIHRGIKSMLKKRRAMVIERKADWALGEALAWGSLLKEGIHVRLSGQDVERGTFSHRHHVLHDQEKDKTTYRPLDNLWPQQAPYTVCNSSLSEFAVLGFDLGFSMTNPHSLVMWEAQFGDFFNTAQCIVDQFIASGQSKWIRQSGIVLLLPHGYEGMGPEHSSAHPERFLSLCSDNPDKFSSDFTPTYLVDQLKETNWQIMNLTTPANYFHAMRRQVKMPFRKPLIVMTPKSLLRLPEAQSSFDEMLAGTEFARIYADVGPASQNPLDVKRVILCSGKIYYELEKERKAKGLDEVVAILRIEQICPFPYDLVKKELLTYPNACVTWVQEEHQNQGAWTYLQPRLNNLLHKHLKDSRRVGYAGRAVSSSPATGNKKQHMTEQAKVLSDALKVVDVPELPQKRQRP